MTMEIYNTLGRRRERFEPAEPGKVKMYVCGPTVYNFFHVGNARPFVVFDVLRRYLEFKGYEVLYIQNFTDVDDKIINRAREEGTSPEELAERYIKAYFEDADRLGIKRATVYPKATEHIGDMISLIQRLLERGFAYVIGGDVYFDVSKFEGYGKLSGKRISELEAGYRVEPNPLKRNPLDFALWKAHKEGEPWWDSPWGPGRPGWHIECSAMAFRYAPEGLDLHCGGEDLIFPHHENEIAQTEAATGKMLARYWLHNGFLLIDKEKMSKSLGNFMTARQAMERYDPIAIRIFMLSAHYRSPLNFSEDNLRQAESSLRRLRNFYLSLEEGLSRAQEVEPPRELVQEIERVTSSFKSAMEDDLNTAEALASVFELVKALNPYLQEPHPSAQLLEMTRSFLLGVEEVMGIMGLKELKGGLELDVEVERLIRERDRARKEKNWAKADSIRDKLSQMGIRLEDTPYGTRWRRSNRP